MKAPDVLNQYEERVYDDCVNLLRRNRGSLSQVDTLFRLRTISNLDIDSIEVLLNELVENGKITLRDGRYCLPENRR